MAINNQSFSPYEALIFLNKIAARHGIGRVDIVENRLVQNSGQLFLVPSLFLRTGVCIVTVLFCLYQHVE